MVGSAGGRDSGDWSQKLTASSGIPSAPPHQRAVPARTAVDRPSQWPFGPVVWRPAAAALVVVVVGLGLANHSLWGGEWFATTRPDRQPCPDLGGVEGCYSNSELNVFFNGAPRTWLHEFPGFETSTEPRTQWYVATGYLWLWWAAAVLSVGPLLHRRVPWWPLPFAAIVAAYAAYVHNHVLDDLAATATAGPMSSATLGTRGFILVAVGCVLGLYVRLRPKQPTGA